MWCWPSLPALLSLSLPVWQSEVHVKAAKKKKKKNPKGWTNIDTNSLCEWRCTNLWVIQSWNSREWINWTLKGLQRGGLNGQTVGHDRETGLFFNALQESGVQARPWMHHRRRASSEVSDGVRYFRQQMHAAGQVFTVMFKELWRWDVSRKLKCRLCLQVHKRNIC